MHKNIELLIYELTFINGKVFCQSPEPVFPETLTQRGGILPLASAQGRQGAGE